MDRRGFLGWAAAPLLSRRAWGQEEPPVDFVCPMDRDVRERGPGKCPRCGMALVANLPDAVEYLLEVRTAPRLVRPGREVTFEFAVRDPRTRKPVREFEVMHEKLFHLFVISQDLQFFAHEHPAPLADGRFRFRTVLPKAGEYRLACDFFPKGGTPQFLTRTIFTAGSGLAEGPRLEADVGPKRGVNLSAELTMEPAEALAGLETLFFLKVSPREGLETYLGAWAHLLAASDDLIDVVHDHPLYTYLDQSERPQIQFNLLFPRERMYRVWVQFQRLGVVNTVAFNVPVKALR